LKSAQAFYGEDGSFQGGVEILRPAPGPPKDPLQLSRFEEVVDFHGLKSRHPEMHLVFERIRAVAGSGITVLVRGESGAGKELVARAVHAESGRKDGPFVAVNCSALTATLAESTLFGHRKGAFTGAHEDREGLFAQADGGTLFLDEVAELSPDMQARLLRVLEDGEAVPVGGDAAVQVDVRIVAATHRSLREEVAAGRFREDLMFRLRVVPIYLPALRERRTDIEPLIWHFLHREQVASTRAVAQIEPDAMRRLMDHTWPGNVRELKNAVQHAYVVGRGPVLAAKDLPRELLESRRGMLLPILGDEPAESRPASRGCGPTTDWAATPEAGLGPTDTGATGRQVGGRGLSGSAEGSSGMQSSGMQSSGMQSSGMGGSGMGGSRVGGSGRGGSRIGGSGRGGSGASWPADGMKFISPFDIRQGDRPSSSFGNRRGTTQPHSPGPSNPAGTADVERIRRALASHPGDLSAAARALGVSRTTLWRKRKRFGL
jgi:transcriptional regulator with PAS, ATPase and Fis domain